MPRGRCMRMRAGCCCWKVRRSKVPATASGPRSPRPPRASPDRVADVERRRCSGALPGAPPAVARPPAVISGTCPSGSSFDDRLNQAAQELARRLECAYIRSRRATRQKDALEDPDRPARIVESE